MIILLIIRTQYKVRASHSVLCPVMAKLKPVLLTVVAVPCSVITGEGNISLGLKSLKISGEKDAQTFL